MKRIATLSVALLLCLGFAAAGETETVTLEGQILCAKCSMGEQAECQNVLVVEAKPEAKHYYMTKNDVYLEMGEVCEDSRVARVTGTVEEKEGKMWLAATEIVRVEEEG